MRWNRFWQRSHLYMMLSSFSLISAARSWIEETSFKSSASRDEDEEWGETGEGVEGEEEAEEEEEEESIVNTGGVEEEEGGGGEVEDE